MAVQDVREKTSKNGVVNRDDNGPGHSFLGKLVIMSLTKLQLVEMSGRFSRGFL